MALCEMVVEAAEVVPTTLSNLANKTIKIPGREEVGRALPIKFIWWLKYNEERNKGQTQIDMGGGIK